MAITQVGGFVAAAGCERPPSSLAGGDPDPPITGIGQFVDVTQAAGIDWTAPLTVIRISAGGAFLDVDRDGWLDIAVAGEGSQIALYRGAEDGRFTDITVAAGLEELDEHPTTGVFVADYDGDSDVDIYLTRAGPNLLLANDGTGVFSDVTVAAGVGDDRWSTAAAFGDYDGDGDLDLFVGNYIAELDFPGHTPFPNELYRNNGDGSFTAVGESLGVAAAGTTLAATWSDYDGDGDAELFVCNDFGAFIEPNQLYQYNGVDFDDIGPSLGADLAVYCMGIAVGDVNGDQRLDYYFTDIGGNSLLRQEVDHFVDVARDVGAEVGRLPMALNLLSGWSSSLLDANSDGLLDLFVVNGYIPADDSIENERDAPNFLLLQSGDGTFSEVAGEPALANTGFGRGSAFGDYDRDGDLDILVVNLDEAQLIRNDSPQGAWAQFELRGSGKNTEAIGARVLVRGGGRTQIREVTRNHGYASSSDAIVHVGLGEATVIDEIVITWPDGTQTNAGGLAVNTRHVFEQ